MFLHVSPAKVFLNYINNWKFEKTEARLDSGITNVQNVMLSSIVPVIVMRLR